MQHNRLRRKQSNDLAVIEAAAAAQLLGRGRSRRRSHSRSRGILTRIEDLESHGLRPRSREKHRSSRRRDSRGLLTRIEALEELQTSRNSGRSSRGNEEDSRCSKEDSRRSEKDSNTDSRSEKPKTAERIVTAKEKTATSAQTKEGKKSKSATEIAFDKYINHRQNHAEAQAKHLEAQDEFVAARDKHLEYRQNLQKRFHLGSEQQSNDVGNREAFDDTKMSDVGRHSYSRHPQNWPQERFPAEHWSEELPYDIIPARKSHSRRQGLRGGGGGGGSDEHFPFHPHIGGHDTLSTAGSLDHRLVDADARARLRGEYSDRGEGAAMRRAWEAEKRAQEDEERRIRERLEHIQEMREQNQWEKAQEEMRWREEAMRKQMAEKEWAELGEAFDEVHLGDSRGRGRQRERVGRHFDPSRSPNRYGEEDGEDDPDFRYRYVPANIGRHHVSSKRDRARNVSFG